MTRRRKYTDEQLSRILGEADCGSYACVNEAATGTPCPDDPLKRSHCPNAWDWYYKLPMDDPEALLRELEARGFA